MPQFIRNPKQEQALSTIIASLSELKNLNSVLTKEPVAFKLSSSGGFKSRIELDDGLTEKITILLKDRRKNLIRLVRSLARENRIELDDKDERILSEDLTCFEMPENTEKPSPESLS